VIVLYQLRKVDQKNKNKNKKYIGSFLNFTKVRDADKKLKINIPVSN
jgi:hypothetical protein